VNFLRSFHGENDLHREAMIAPASPIACAFRATD
jgi:hypothetical protein